MSEVSLQILRTVVELVALGVVVYGVATGVAYIIAGSRGHWAGIVGLVGQPAEALDDFSDAFTGGDSWLLSRLFGVVITALSALGGFLALFFGYQVWEIYRIFYRFFARRD